ncbi:general transcription factor IIH subunit 4-like isoform X1 [Crassostrea angulata]|uniref:general transcription factor IIH subunit 4-like isoform X1 n=1 Tax=Magallana angulata TaxID=2784310 RepID=UPI0022B18B81|nr:general transcription factor IIH subunit 4-like isoform X1 [Crassostrea angulata]
MFIRHGSKEISLVFLCLLQVSALGCRNGKCIKEVRMQGLTRQLPQLSKHYVMRMLFIEQPVSQSAVGLWVTNKHNEEHKFAAKVLSELRVWHEQQMQGGLLGWVLNGTFRSNMKVALLGGGMDSQFAGGPLPPDKHAKDIPFLDKYALERWECVLHFMVGSTEGTEGVSKDIIDVLLNAGLMTMDGVDPMPSITPAGFQFLLMDIGSQVWYFMLQYLDTVEARGMDLIDCLSFLFQLSFSTLGKDYSTENMNEGQQRFLQHLREFGLVYQRKRKIQRYYPTRLAINLASGQSDFTSVGKNTGYLMVETNYRVYAYTDSPLQVALVALFCEMLYRFPTFSVGNLTRVSVRDALIRGITADQIISFLKTHAHPKMTKNTPVIPSTVTDQIRLWELERDRFKFMEGVLYDQFLSQNDFELLRDYAKDLGVLLWDNAIKRVMVVTKGGHDDVKRYWKRQKQSNS